MTIHPWGRWFKKVKFKNGRTHINFQKDKTPRRSSFKLEELWRQSVEPKCINDNHGGWEMESLLLTRMAPSNHPDHWFEDLKVWHVLTVRQIVFVVTQLNSNSQMSYNLGWVEWEMSHLQKRGVWGMWRRWFDHMWALQVKAICMYNLWCTDFLWGDKVSILAYMLSWPCDLNPWKFTWG